MALGRPALRVVQTGAFDAAGAGLAAHVLAAYAIGLLGYAGFQLHDSGLSELEIST